MTGVFVDGQLTAESLAHANQLPFAVDCKAMQVMICIS